MKPRLVDVYRVKRELTDPGAVEFRGILSGKRYVSVDWLLARLDELAAPNTADTWRNPGWEERRDGKEEPPCLP